MVRLVEKDDDILDLVVNPYVESTDTVIKSLSNPMNISLSFLKKANIQKMTKQKDNFTIVIDKSHIKRNITHYVAMWLWIGWTFFYLILFPLLYFLYFISFWSFTSLISLIILSMLYSTNRSKQPSWGYTIGDWINLKALEYFHVKMIIENELELINTKQALFALEPHDVLPLSIFAFNDICGGLKQRQTFGCITSVCFSIPLMKHIYTWVNAVSVDKKNMTKLLNQGKSLVVCPGGVQEVTLLENNHEIVLYLKSRLGFVKLAMQYGIPIVPAFTFGLRDSFSFWVPKGQFFHKLSKVLGFMPMLFFGMFSLPLGPSKPCDYSIVIGKPICLPKCDNPSEEEIRKYHSEYIQEITRIYELFKDDFGLQDVSLRIA